MSQPEMEGREGTFVVPQGQDNDESLSKDTVTDVGSRSKSQTNPYLLTDTLRPMQDMYKHTNSEWYYNDLDLRVNTDGFASDPKNATHYWPRQDDEASGFQTRIAS